jgi:hypothetical protein
VMDVFDIPGNLNLKSIDIPGKNFDIPGKN